MSERRPIVDTADGKGGQSMSDLLHEEDGIYFVRTKPLLLSDLLVLRRRVTKAGPHWIDRDTGVRVIEMAMRSLLARPVDEDEDDDPGPRPGDNTVLGL